MTKKVAVAGVKALLEVLHQQGVQKIEALLSHLPEWCRLSKKQLRPYREFVAGWEVPNLCSDPLLHLRLLVGAAFPFTPPRLAVYPAPPVLEWPNLEEEGILCLLPNGSATSIVNVEAVVLKLLEEGQTLVNESLRGEGLERFEDEFVSYWERWRRKSKHFVSLCDPEGPTRWVYSYPYHAFTLVAETKDSIKSWGLNFYGRNPKLKWVEKIPFIILDRPLRPGEYPKFVYNLLDTISDNDGANRIVQEYLLSVPSLSRKKILVGFPGRNGFGFAGLVLPQVPDLARLNCSPRTPIEKLGNGFRPDKISGAILLNRYCSVPLRGASVKRSDGLWVHGRGHNPDTGLLMKKTVIFVGTGSLGSGVVEILAKIGVGKIHLIDPEALEPENASRHTLGVHPTPVLKAETLVEGLKKRFPHLDFEFHSMKWERVYERTPKVFTSADLIISTIGSLAAEGPLNVIANGEFSFPPVVFGWLEDHAAAGHAIAVFGGRGCLQCLMDNHGRIKVPVTQWPEKETLIRVPMCGGMFQPYGAVELSHVQALVADIATDTLLSKTIGPAHQVWIGQKKLLSADKGIWNPDWQNSHGNPGEGGKILNVPFANDRSCCICKGL